MGGAAPFPARRSRPACAKILYPLVLVMMFSSFSVAAAFGTFRHRRPLKCGSVASGIVSIAAPPPGKDSNRCSSGTARRSAESDDATAGAPAPTAGLSPADVGHVVRAARLAGMGLGNTFPNPAVGCVLVRRGDGGSSPDAVVGSGFHPRAGMPHAEVFALLEACGHVGDGEASARSVMGGPADGGEVSDLLGVYGSEGGASKLFGGCFDDCHVTAYVTLEPCCHFGQTPPCAMSLVVAGVDRVVVGYRDPNPRVDGGGIQLLQDAGVDVQVLRQSPEPEKDEGEEDASDEEMEAARECSDLVKYFVKRISPREGPGDDLDDVVDGKRRRALRGVAGRQKSAGTMETIGWPKDESVTDDDRSSSEFAERIPLSNQFLERVDQALWDHEITLLRLNNAVRKKKGAKVLGGRIAGVLNAHVAQVIGHTVLLYRPALPPVLDLDELVERDADDGDRSD